MFENLESKVTIRGVVVSPVVTFENIESGELCSRFDIVTRTSQPDRYTIEIGVMDAWSSIKLEPGDNVIAYVLSLVESERIADTVIVHEIYSAYSVHREIESDKVWNVPTFENINKESKNMGNNNKETIKGVPSSAHDIIKMFGLEDQYYNAEHNKKAAGYVLRESLGMEDKSNDFITQYLESDNISHNVRDYVEALIEEENYKEDDR